MVSKALSLAKLLGDNNKLSTDTFGDDVSTIEQASSTDVLTNLGNTVGDQRLVGSNLYIWNGTGWYRIALINETPTWDSGGQPLSYYQLDDDSPQNATVITLAASDPDGLPISYSYVTGGSMDSMATISQNSSVFTITPKTLAQVGEGIHTGSITFRASDGVNILPQISSFTLSFTTWPNATQQAKLTASDAQAGDFFGHATALSSDGNTAIIGAVSEDTGGAGAGAAYIFTRSGTTWSQEAKIQASDAQAGDSFGIAVAISDDGNTVIVGAYEEDAGAGGSTDSGAAYVFTRSGTTWSQEAKLMSSDIQAGDYFGSSVAISSDGNTVSVSGIFDDTPGIDAGSVYVFTRSGTTWSQQAKIQSSDIQAGDNLGRIVSLSDDGNTLFVGARNEDTGGTDAGSAYIFTRSGTTWSQEAKIQASDAQAGDFFGFGGFISGDGNTVIVGAYLEDTGGTDAGAAYIFTRSGTTWSQEAKLTASDAQAGDSFGMSVCVSRDGNTAIVGAYLEDTGGTDAGSAYIFTRSGTTWTQEVKIQSSDIQAGDYFGRSVSISKDGDIVIVGAREEDTGGSGAGAAYVFIKG